MINIRKANENDFEQIWEIFHLVVKNGDTYVFSPNTSKVQAKNVWLAPTIQTYVAEINEEILGTYIIKQNQPDLGSHVANAAFMVHPKAQGQGIGKQMGLDAIEQAKKLGYIAMQFNFVISTNTKAIKLWESLGFKIVGTLPKAFNHHHLGYVDAYVMHRFLL